MPQDLQTILSHFSFIRLLVNFGCIDLRCTDDKLVRKINCIVAIMLVPNPIAHWTQIRCSATVEQNLSRRSSVSTPLKRCGRVLFPPFLQCSSLHGPLPILLVKIWQLLSIKLNASILFSCNFRFRRLWWQLSVMCNVFWLILHLAATVTTVSTQTCCNGPNYNATVATQKK